MALSSHPARAQAEQGHGRRPDAGLVV